MRKLLIVCCLAAAALAQPAFGAPRELAPGIVYQRQVEFTRHGPVVLNILTAPRPTGLYSLGPALSNDAVVAKEPLTAIEKRLTPWATVAGVNGDTTLADGRPGGLVIQNGVLHVPPIPSRSSLGVDRAGNLYVDRVELFGTWQGTGQRRPLSGVNEPPPTNGVSVYTPAYGPTTPPAGSDTASAIITPFSPTTASVPASGPVTQIVPGGGHRIPDGGAVLVARGGQVGRLTAEAAVGTTVTLRLPLKPDWSGMLNAIGGGPALVRNGKAIFRAGEAFPTALLVPRRARTGVGQARDGHIVMVVTDGGRPGYSVGMTNYELARVMARLGAVTAYALDSGEQSAMAFEGQLLSRPRAGEPAISDALVLSYYGVQAAEIDPVVSPNGDGVNEREELTYKVVVPSKVTATLTGPRGEVAYAEQGVDRAPGTYKIVWNGRFPDGSAAPEGRWHWNVAATDNEGRSSYVQRDFSLNNTLKALRVQPGSRLRVSFTLTRPARVTVATTTPSGTLLRRLFRGQRGAGEVSLSWGRSVLPRRSYLVRVTAANELGRVELTGPSTARRRR